VPVSDTLSNVLGKAGTACVAVIRHAVNIGANANILRCFEVCDSEWLWVLCDDDPPLPDAIEKILRYLRIYESTTFLHFATEQLASVRQHSFTRDMKWGDPFRVTGSLSEFLAAIDSWSEVLLLSNGVYRVGTMGNCIETGYNYAGTLAPHLAILISSMARQHAGACFLAESIVEWGGCGEEALSTRVQYYLGVMGLLDLVETPELRRRLARAISKEDISEWRAFKDTYSYCRRRDAMQDLGYMYWKMRRRLLVHLDGVAPAVNSTCLAVAASAVGAFPSWLHRFVRRSR
jgi:hypothetical protein